MSSAMVEQIKSLQSQFQDSNQKSKPFSLLDKGELTRRAEAMGPGVSVASTKKIKRPWGEGYQAIYAFQDINALKLQQNPAKKAPAFGQQEGSEKKEDVVTFRFAKGSPANLTIDITQRAWEKDTTEQQVEEADSGTEKMMLEMLKGLRFTNTVEVQGRIQKTNAGYRDGSKITLVDVDFEKLVSDKEQFKKVSKSKPKSLEEAKALFKDVPGLKFETNSTVTVRFE